MVVIIELNGTGAQSIMGLILDKNGVTKIWNTYKSALSWAKRNCAFRYKIVDLN